MLKPKRETRKKRIRAKIWGSAKIPRLVVFRSNKFIYSQVINDEKGATVAASHGVNPEAVGAEVAERAKKAKINSVVFDRGGYRYHGKIKALAEAARKGGLSF